MAPAKKKSGAQKPGRRPRQPEKVQESAALVEQPVAEPTPSPEPLSQVEALPLPQMEAIPLPATEDKVEKTEPLSLKRRALQVWRDFVGGLKQVKEDVKTLSELKHKTASESGLSLPELVRRRLIRRDVGKLLPYSFFLTVPGSSLLLPPYLWLFPRSTPSQFLSEASKAKRVENLRATQLETRDQLAEHLRGRFPAEMKRLEELTAALAAGVNDAGLREKLKAADRDMLEAVRSRVGVASSNLGRVTQLNPEMQELLLRFLGKEYVTGRYIANKILNLPVAMANFFSKHFAKTGQFAPVRECELWREISSPASKSMIALQLNSLLGTLQLEDKVALTDKAELHTLTPVEAEELLLNRGIAFESPEGALEFYRRYWLREARDGVDAIARVLMSAVRQPYARHLIN